jgi:hypothetical protein
MKFFRHKVLGLAFLAACFSGLGAWADQGTTAAAFLKLATGPRVIAMGENFAGLADDVNALNYNPAGLAFLQDHEITVMHAAWFQDIFYDNLGLAWPIKALGGTLGLNLLYLNGGSFDKYVAVPAGTPGAVQDSSTGNWYGPAGTFTASDMSLGVAYSRAILPFLSAGLLAKYITENIDGNGASSFAVDMSVLYKLSIPGLAVGLNVQNLGPSMGYSQTYNLPINFRLGVGYKPYKPVSLVADYTQPIETAGVLGIGGEYSYRDFLVVRGGYKYQGAIDYNQTYVGFGPSTAAGLSMGFGLMFHKFGGIDFAYVPYGFLGSTYRVAYSFKW